MAVEVTLLVTGVNLRDDDTVIRLAETLSDYMFSGTSGITTMTVFTEGDPVAEVVQAVRRAEAQGIKVRRVMDEKVNVNEIARRIGDFSREAVRKWTQDPSFPLPIAVRGEKRTSYDWRWADVVGWLMHAKGIDMDEDLPDEKTVAHIDACIHNVKDYRSDAIHVHLDTPTKRADVIELHRARRSPSQWEVHVTDAGRSAQVTASAL